MKGSKPSRAPSFASTAERSSDEQPLRNVAERILVRYLGLDAAVHLEPIMAAGHTTVTIMPQDRLAGDYTQD